MKKTDVCTCEICTGIADGSIKAIRATVVETPAKPQTKAVPKKPLPEITPYDKILIRLIHLFDRLGDTVQDWRAQMIRDDIKANPGRSNSCAIAMYLKPHFPQHQVSVSGGGISVVKHPRSAAKMVCYNFPTSTFLRGGTSDYEERGTLGDRHHATLRTFVSQFDQKMFPELIKGRK